MMKKPVLVLLAVFSFTAAAGAQEFRNETHEFLVARLEAADGRYDEALQRLDRIIAKNPGNEVLLYERAMILVDLGRIDRAESELRSLVARHPGLYDANRLLGRIILDGAGADRARVEEALRYLHAAFQANPDDLPTGMIVSQILGSLDRNEEAERILAAMVERSPDQRALNYNYAQILTKLGRASESKQYLERVLLVDPTFRPAIMQLLEIYQEENEWVKAAELLHPLIAEEPVNLDLQRQQGFYFLRGGDARNARERFEQLVKADATDMRSLFYLAEALNDLEEYTEAEAMFRKVLAAQPEDIDALASLALSLSGQKKWDEATQTFNRLLVAPGVPENLVALGRTQLAYIDLQKENYDAAIETAKPILVFRDRPNAQAINIALSALKKQNKTSEALALLEPLVAKFDSDPFVNARYVEALVRAEQTEKAKEHAALQAKIGPRNAIAAAEAYIQADDYDSATQLIESAIGARPDDLELRFQLGAIHERAGDRKAAEKQFLEVLENHPNHAPSLNYLGYMWAENNMNLEQAHEMLTRAVGQEPTNGAYVDSLGWVYFRLGKLELAEKYLSDAARLLPRDPTIIEHLADVYASRGNTERAVQLYRTAIDLDPDSKDVEKIRSKISEIERQGQKSER